MAMLAAGFKVKGGITDVEIHRMQSKTCKEQL